MSTETSNVNDSALRVLDVLEVLCGFAVSGASNKALAAAAGISPVAVTRATATLVAKGWCRRNEDTGRFYPTHQFTRLTFRVLDDIASAETRLADTRRSITGRAS